jgi:tartrate dehydrogenase/decarboxylase/D-malate dehydrogenase
VTVAKTFRIAIYPGDGIGVDVTREAVRVMQRVQQLDGSFTLDLTHLDWGCDYHDRHGRVMPANYLEIVRGFDAILLGAVGFPSRLPDHVTLEPLVGIRQNFRQYACVRPAKLLPGVKSLLADPGAIDMVVVRENAEGEYVACGGRSYRGCDDEVAIQTSVHTRRGVERILRFGFELARTRRHKLTMITKSNAMQFSMVMWDEVLDALRPQYRDVETDRQHVDAAAMNFVRKPASFDVVVASNLFGDILTDLSGAIVGSLGMNPSANLNPDRAFPSLFEPVHGSAPDIAGKGIANPVGAIQSAAMMLDWLGARDAARRITAAVERALADGHKTPDIGGKLTTTALADAIIQRL